jgi:hypothetical protein
MDVFADFKADLNREIEKRGADNVMYIALNDTYWIKYEDFMILSQPPRVMFLNREQFGSWSVPPKFQVVMKDHSVLRYKTCIDDPYYSSWVWFDAIRRPPRRYVSRPCPTVRTFGHFINNIHTNR